ncbi:MAG TPA: tetratricopeptide repeat protein [bacterium]|nr:tetratricopeptide repeat protein [bacterium]
MPNRNFISYSAVCLVLLVACRTFAGTAAPAPNPIVLADVEMWRGHQYIEEGRADLAAEALMKAAELNKSSPYPHFMLARLYIRRAPMDAFLEFGTGLKLASADFPYQSLLAANALVIALAAAGAAIFVGVLVILVRHARTVWFSILLTYSPAFGEKWVRLIMIAAIGAFFVMLSGLSLMAMAVWAAAIGCGLAWRYAGASERHMMVALAAFLIVFVPLFDLTARIVSTQHPDSPTRIVALDRDSFDDAMAKLATAGSPLSEKDPVGQFMRGIICLKASQYDRAVDHFSRVSKLAGDNAAILNNIGVAYHNMGRYTEAQAVFERALKLGPKEAVIHYNYSQTLNALLHYDHAQTELTRASGLDFDLTRSLVISKDKPALIPMGLNTGVLWDMAMASGNRTLKSAYNPIESSWQGLLLLAGLVAGAFVLMRKSRLPARCDICERIVKTQIAKRKRREILCADCRAIKQVNADDNDALEQRLEERLSRLENRRSIVSLIVGVLVPGGAYYLLGSKAKGFLFSFTILMLVAVVISHGGPIRPAPRLELGTSIGWALVCLIAVYGLCTWRSVTLVLKTSDEE